MENKKLQELTIEEKRKWLSENGWIQGWSNEDWLQKGRNYTRPDYAGMSTENAFKYAQEQFKKK